MQDKNKTVAPSYVPKRVIELVLHGSLGTVALLTLLLIIFDIANSFWFRERTWVALGAIVFLVTAKVMFHRGHVRTVNWFLIIFYEFLAFVTLLTWGLNAPVGILTTSFAVILPSVLIGSKPILPVTIGTIGMLLTVQALHTLKVITPHTEALKLEADFWDVITYSTILGIFALVSWISGKYLEKNIQRTQEVETELRAQKDSLSIELEKESAELRLTQLKQIRQLHRFALLGQSTAATLHELSNHLSILNLDIDDLRQQHSNSEAIANAKDGIDHINKMVRQARQQLHSYDNNQTFNAISAVRRSKKDLKEKFQNQRISFSKPEIIGSSRFNIKGDPLAMMQISTILINNAIDACYEMPNPEVKLIIENKVTELIISVIDNGVGIDSKRRTSLFKPIKSAKPAGLGAGLYIAQHLIEDQFQGKIELVPTDYGAHFKVTLPKKHKNEDS
ncbi:MAG: ATP-binding protein [Candidatus Microsaccharimonas sp.]